VGLRFLWDSGAKRRFGVYIAGIIFWFGTRTFDCFFWDYCFFFFLIFGVFGIFFFMGGL
jgi:hypothetical protein